MGLFSTVPDCARLCLALPWSVMIYLSTEIDLKEHSDIPLHDNQNQRRLNKRKHIWKCFIFTQMKWLHVYNKVVWISINWGTVPPDLVMTEQIPDLVTIDRTVKPAKVVLLELTVPWDSATSFRAALDRKTARYERLALDLEERGCVVSNMPLEIGCRGVIDKRNSLVLETICNLFNIRAHQRLKGALGRIALLGSYRIYLARRSSEWNGGELISVS